MVIATKAERDNLDVENLLQGKGRFSYGVTSKKGKQPKRHAQKLAKGHLEPRKVSGITYYYYRRGVDAPIFIGNAEAILQMRLKQKGA